MLISKEVEATCIKSDFEMPRTLVEQECISECWNFEENKNFL
jgi:hypothetical protein